MIVTVNAMPSAALLASIFSDTLVDAIGIENTHRAAHENKRRDYDVTCASHDYCDANMVMDYAFRQMVGLTTGADYDMTDEITDLWNAAWDIAKRADFYIEGRLRRPV